jgi:hypothetical protein
VGGGIKKFSAVKISVQGSGACGSGRDMFSGQNFLRLSILLFGRARRSDEERTIRSTDVADEGRGRVAGNYFSAVRFSFVVREREAVRGYVQRLGFFVIEYITFQGGQKRSNTERTIRSTDVADEGRGRVAGNFFQR